jgi:hypothetical protein
MQPREQCRLGLSHVLERVQKLGNVAGLAAGILSLLSLESSEGVAVVLHERGQLPGDVVCNRQHPASA